MASRTRWAATTAEPRSIGYTVDSDHALLVVKVTADLHRSPRTFTFVHLPLPDRPAMVMGSWVRSTHAPYDRPMRS